MPHILIMGPGQPPADTRRRLAAWGLTSAGGGDACHRRPPTVADCDAVLWFGAPPALLPAAADEPAAPVLLVGQTDPHGAAWQVIPPRKAAGDCLRRALELCCARGRALRERGVEDPLRVRWRDFLGHELRSPLTAIRTALEEIEAAPGDPGPLPEIALRNVGRLQQVLEWSQDLLALAESPSGAADEALRALAASAPWLGAADAAAQPEPALGIAPETAPEAAAEPAPVG
ncbi:MAG: hypothetical protein R6X35_07910 [Candidatus Krumholzibacteriia bacterium]